jgi:hypothetical protein
MQLGRVGDRVLALDGCLACGEAPVAYASSLGCRVVVAHKAPYACWLLAIAAPHVATIRHVQGARAGARDAPGAALLPP